jgi:hypothetical protein
MGMALKKDFSEYFGLSSEAGTIDPLVDALSSGLSFTPPQELKRHPYYVHGVLTAVVTKSTIFWDVMPRSPLKVNRNFGGTYRLHL